MALKCLIKSHFAIIASVFFFSPPVQTEWEDVKVTTGPQTAELAFSRRSHVTAVMEKPSIEMGHAQRHEIHRPWSSKQWSSHTHTHTERELIFQPGMCPGSLKLQKTAGIFFPFSGLFKIFATESRLTEGQWLARMCIPHGCLSPDDWHASSRGLHQSHADHCCPTA